MSSAAPDSLGRGGAPAGAGRVGPRDARRRRRLPLADELRRLQALHRRRLPRRLPHRLDLPHRVRHRRRPGGHLQRLRLLRHGVSVRSARPARATTAASGSARSATTGSRTTWSRPARRRVRPTRSSSGRWRSCASGPTDGSRSCTSAGSARRGSTATDPDDGVGGIGAFFLLLDEPETYGLPPDPVVPTRHLGEAWGAAGVAAPALGGGRRSRRSSGGGGERAGSGSVAVAGSPHGAEGPAELLLRAAGRQAAGLDAGRSPGISSPAGIAGGSAVLALRRPARGQPRARAARLAGRAARRSAPARRCSISDLGRPERFLNMLRVFKVDLADERRLVDPRARSARAIVRRRLRACCGLLPPRAGRRRPRRRRCSACRSRPTPAVLLANTAVPVWHEARRELPFVFAASAAASAGAAAVALDAGGEARRRRAASRSPAPSARSSRPG